MATVSNVRLTIGEAATADRRRVSVTYRICFSDCEVLAGSVFVERVTLRGDDPIWDDHLLTLRGACIRAQTRCVDREITRDVSRNRLDEDPDTIILGWVIGDRDEVYARVEVTPFQPSGASGQSPVVSGHFGPAGA